jgi:hypothetical protein
MEAYQEKHDDECVPWFLLNPPEQDCAHAVGKETVKRLWRKSVLCMNTSYFIEGL